MNAMALTDGMVGTGGMKPATTALGTHEATECLAFDPHDQRFTFDVMSSGSVYLATEGDDFVRCKELDAHADLLRRPSSENITHWRVSREAFGEPVCEMVVDGLFFTKGGQVADFLIALAIEGFINDPVNEEEAEIRRQDAEYDRRSACDSSATDLAMMTAINTGSWT